MEYINSINDEHLNALNDWVQNITDFELQARVSDVLWIRKKDYQAAQLSVRAYIESAKNLEDPNRWTSCYDRIERALNLSAKLGKSNSLYSDVIKHVEDVLDKYDGEDPLWLSIKLMSLLLQQKQGLSSKYSALSKKDATLAECSRDWDRARNYWYIKAQWHRKEQNRKKERKSLLRAAKTYIKEAKQHLKSKSLPYIRASHCLQSAIVALRKIKGTEKKRHKVHRLLHEYQSHVPSEMIPSYGNYDSDSVESLIEFARTKVQSKSLHEALLNLALLSSSPSVDSIRQQVEEDADKYVGKFLFPTILHNQMGKVIARQADIYSADPQEKEAGIEAEMITKSNYFRQLKVQALIEPAREQINLEHNVRVEDFLFIVNNNPFVPAGREFIFAKGLYFGLKGDFLIAVNLLIPQVENSLRYLLDQSDVITTGYNDQGIQDEHNINTFFREQKSALIEIFNSEDIVFDLQGLLVSRFGSNLRNRTAHGLIDYSAFYAYEDSYFWWMILYLCCLPLVALNRSKVKKRKRKKPRRKKISF